jgi:uncharacterized protein YchJ
MKNKQVYVLRGCVLLGVAALSACSAPVKKDDGALVEARATERWNYLIAHQAEKAYDYLSPGYRQTITREKYASQKNDVAVRWKGAHVTGRNCEAEACTVTVMIDALVPMPGLSQEHPTALPTEERWIKVSGNWYYLPDTRVKGLPATPAEAKPDAATDAAKHPI